MKNSLNMLNSKQCCLKCGFHFFDEEECPNCEAERIVKEYQAEWDRQLRLLEINTCIKSNDDFWALWYANQTDMKNWFRTLCRNVAPDIYDWYEGMDMERLREQSMQVNRQMNLFEEELPF